MGSGDVGCTPSAAVIRDLTVPYETKQLRMVLWAVIPAMIASILAKEWLPPTFHYCCFLLAMFAGMISFERVSARRACSAMRALERNSPARGDDVSPDLIAVLRRYTSQLAQGWAGQFRRRNVAGSFAALMLRRGHTGTVFRLANDPLQIGGNPSPWPTPFEPILLRQREPALLALRAEDAAPRSRVREYWDRIRETHGNSRRMMLVLLVSWVFFVIGSILSVYWAIRDLLVGKLPEVFFVLWPTAALLTGLWLWRLLRPEEWYIVPGALVVRSSAWNSSKWQLHLLARADSVLVYWRDLRLMAIADTTGRSFARLATPVEAETAIRAWLSPLPPPSLEQLGDLH